MLDHRLYIVRGAPFRAHAWPLIDSAGNPIRATDGLTVTAKIRPFPSSDEAVVLSTSLVMLTVPGQYGGEPVAAAQLNAMPAETTAQWFDFSGHVWELAVSGDPMVGGLVDTPWRVSR